MTIATPQVQPPLLDWRLELELTNRCQLTCVHCYAESGPTGGHGSMTGDDWCRLVDDAAASGFASIQLIGGEPTSHPDFGGILEHATGTNLQVEVYSNLLHITDACWDLFTRPRVSLATSYYSDRPSEHAHITGRGDSHARTRAHIAEAIDRGIPLRAGIIDMGDGQRVEQAREELMAMGVRQVGIDRVRSVGRGTQTLPDMSELCGGCGRGQAAISPDGDVWPCVLARWMTAGNVKQQSLAEILHGERWHDLVATIPGPRARCHPDNQCNPDKEDCRPKKDGGDCAPADRSACYPKFCNPDTSPKDPKK